MDVDPDRASDKVDVTLTSTLGGVSIACLYRQSLDHDHAHRDQRSEPRRHRHHGEDCTKDDAFELVSCTDATVLAGVILTTDRVTLSVTLAPNAGAVREASAELLLKEVEPCASSDGGVDGSAGDGGARDTGVDTGQPDTGLPDTGAPDTGAPDTGPSCSPATCTPTSPCDVATCVAGACTHAAASPGTACPASDACNVGACDSAGVCVESPVPLPAVGPCQRAFCDPALGIVIVNQPDDTSCAANACATDSCHAGVCVAGPPRVCTTTSECLTASCDPAAGCIATPKAAGSSCSQDVCSPAACDGAGTCVSGPPPDCSSHSACIIDACSPIAGCTHTPVPSCDPTPLRDQRFEDRASLLGRLTSASGPVTDATFTVTDAPSGFVPSPPRTDAVVQTGSDGSFRLRLTSFPAASASSDETPAAHVLLKIESSAHLPVYRDAWLRSGDAVDLGVIRFIARDPAVTNIGPAGGTATDSLHRIEVVVPPGALTTTIPIRITPIEARDDMQAPLPISTPTLYGFDLSPDGTQFAVPVTVRLTNWRSAPTTVPIPTGFFDAVTGRWEHVGVATWDAALQRFVFTLDHFTPFDCNYARGGPGPAPKPGDGPPPDDGDCKDVGSSCNLPGGGLRNELTLPSYRVRNEDFAITLAYDSGKAASRTLGESGADYASVARSTFAVPLRAVRFSAECLPSGPSLSGAGPLGMPGACAVQSVCSLGGAVPTPLTLAMNVAGMTVSRTVTLGQANNEAELDAFLRVPLAKATDVASRGLYPAHLEVRAQTGSACITSSTTFGVSDPSAARTQTSLEDGPLASIDMHVFVDHRVSSPFGAGWAVSELSRLFIAGDVAFLSKGHGTTEHFQPRAHVRPFGQNPAGRIMPTRDPRTGELIAVIDGGSIHRIDPVTGAFTAILGSVPVSGVQGVAIGYVGNVRHFVIAESGRLVDVDAAGALRLLATRSGGVGTQPQVAARDDIAFYTDDLTPALYRVRLSDAAPTLEPLSLGAGGDVRLYPRAPLSGVTFANPRGVALDPGTGVLYMADRRRNVVYGIEPDASGVVGPASRVAPILGDGGSGFLSPLGERAPGPRFSVREPLGVAVAEDGTVLAMSSYGMLAYNPVSRDAEWLFRWSSNEEIVNSPLKAYVGYAPLTATSIVSVDGQFSLMRFDVDRLSSERDPSRTIARLAGPSRGYELVDTTAEIVERFDAAGRLVERRHRTGEPIFTATYADLQSDRVTSITDAVGGENVFTYDAGPNGKLQRITDARGRVTEVTINAQGDLVTLRDPASETYAFTYESHRMSEKRSPRGDLTTYTFRADGTLATAVRPEGGTSTLDAALSHPATLNPQGRLERTGHFTDKHGVSHDLVIDQAGQVIKDTYVADGVTRVDQAIYAGNQGGTTFELFDIPPSSTNGQGNESLSSRRNLVSLFRIAAHTVNGVQTAPTMVFDAHGRRRREFTTTLADLHRWAYDDQGYLRLTAEDLTPTVLYERDALGHVTRIADTFVPPSRETLYTYRPDGLVATMTNHGVQKTYAYDDASGTKNETGWTDALGRSMTYTRDARGNITSTFDGIATTFAGYDLKNRLLETRDALGNATTYGYAHAGCNCSQENLVTSIHTPDLPAGVDWTMTYDRDARLSAVTDPQGFTEQYSYESTGELKQVIDKLLRPTTWTHDQLGRVTAMTDTLGRSHAHAYAIESSGVWSGPTLMSGSGDPTPPTVSLTAPLRSGDYQIGHNAYPNFGFPANISVYRDATFELGYTEYTDRVRRLAQRNDRVGLAIASAAIPNAGTNNTLRDEVFTYDGRTTAPVIASMTSTAVTGPFESAIFTRDRWLDVQNHDAYLDLPGDSLSITFTRDLAGRPLTQSWTYGRGTSPSSTYTYRPDGRLARLVNPDGVHDFSYDSRGLMETQTVGGEGTYTFGYDVMGRNDFLEYPDGHVRRQRFDELGRLTSRCYEYPPTAPRCYTASYDAIGNPVRMTDPDGVDVIAYDELDRLTRVTRQTVDGVTLSVEDYAYNALGALRLNAGAVLDHQRPRLDGAGLADAAVPATLGGQPVVLDRGGSVTSLKGTAFKWSKKGFLESIQEPAPAAPILFGVDAELRRTAQKQGAAFDEVNYYEGLDRVAILHAPTGAVKESYLFDGIDHPLRIKRNTTTAYYELDLASNVRALYASGGSPLGGYRYTAFGKTAEDTTTFAQPLRWKGRWHSVVGGTELYDVRARQWSPELGVFLAIDDYQFHDGKTTLWGWPANNPNRFVDPLGRGRLCVPINLFLFICISWPDEPSTCNAPPPPQPTKGTCNDPCDMEQGQDKCFDCCNFLSKNVLQCKDNCCTP